MSQAVPRPTGHYMLADGLAQGWMSARPREEARVREADKSSTMRRRTVAAATVAGLTAALCLAVGPAAAVAPPVGPLPDGSVTKVVTVRGSLLAVAVPRQRETTGLVWRVARQFDARVVRQVSEAEVGSAIVLVFKAVGAGRTSIVLALTRGETPKAFKAARYDVQVN
jgi:hypothetical protein